MVTKQQGISRLLSLLVGWGGFLILVWVGSHFFQTKADRMNFLSVLVIMGGGSWAVIARKRRAGLPQWKDWLVALPAAATCLLAGAETSIALRRLLQAPTRDYFAEYELRLSVLVGVLLLWIVVFPFDDLIPGSHARVHRWIWRGLFLALGLVLGWYVVLGGLNVVADVLRDGESAVLQQVTDWMQRTAFLLGAFLAARIFLPQIFSDIAALLRGTSAVTVDGR